LDVHLEVCHLNQVSYDQLGNSGLSDVECSGSVISTQYLTVTAAWLREHSNEIDAIVQFKLGKYPEWKDVAQYVSMRLLNNDALSKYNPAKGTWKTFFFTTVVRAMMSYSKAKVPTWNSSMCQVNEEVMPSEPWVTNADARIDLDTFMSWCDRNLANRSWR